MSKRVHLDDFNEIPSATAESTGAYEALDIGELLARPATAPDHDWSPRIVRGDTALFAGDPGVGKSIVSLALAAAMASGGGEVLGESVAARRVVFIDLESPDDVLRDRLRAFASDADPDALAYIWRPEDWRSLASQEGRERLRMTLALHRAGFCVVDSLRRAAPDLDENDSRVVSGTFTPLREIAKELGCTILVVHHPRKPMGDAPVEALYAARGSGDLLGSVDSYLYFRRLKGGLVRIEHAKSRRREAEPLHYRVEEDELGGPALVRVDVEERDEAAHEELLERVIEYVREHPGAPTKDVEDDVEGSRKRVREALERGATHNVLALGPGRHPSGNYWYPAGHAALRSPDDAQATVGDTSPGQSQGEVVAGSPRPRRGGETRGDTCDGDDRRPLSVRAEELEWQ